jgi:hypothetical protein
MAPPLRDGGIDHLGRPSTVATSTNRRDQTEDRNPDNAALFGGLPEGRRRKFILVEDPQRGCRVRVKVMLDQVDMKEIPDSYRKSNSVFPRTYFPVQSPFGQIGAGRRFSDDEAEDEEDEEMSGATVGRTLVPVPMLEGEANLAVPKIARKKRDKEVLLNDLGYRMSWGQSRVFAGRTLFLQKARGFYFYFYFFSVVCSLSHLFQSRLLLQQFCLFLSSFTWWCSELTFAVVDAYRNKMRSTMLTAGQEVTSVAPHFETRVGKRKWLERSKRNRAAAADGTPAVVTSSSSRSAEEVDS